MAENKDGKERNWGIFFLGVIVAFIVWGVTGELFAGVIAGLAIRVIGAFVTGSKMT